jgi:hypothetical protein
MAKELQYLSFVATAFKPAHLGTCQQKNIIQRQSADR